MRNIKLMIEYDGTHFHGWQTQTGKRTVQEAIEDVLFRILRHKVNLIGASRTDAGVHALAQTANFQTGHTIPCSRLFMALNGLLPPGVSVHEVQEAKPSFNSRKHARSKLYRYLIWNKRSRSALLAKRAWHVWSPLELSKMKEAARCLEGLHDFSAFRGTKSDIQSSVREIQKIQVKRSREGVVSVEIRGNGFLKYMVRNILGTLVEIGCGKRDIQEMKSILHGKDRKKAGVTAPAHGLYLVSVSFESRNSKS